MSSPVSGKPHILIVEDEAHLAIGIKYNLEAEGYRVTVAAEGHAALQLLSTEEVDLVILDLMLPGMSGYAVCESIREAGNDVPVLMLSARTLAEDRIRGYDTGADQYLQKPFDLDELLAMARGLLARRSRTAASATVTSAPRPQLPEVYEFGEARVNFRTFEASMADREVKLTPLDIKLLHYLVDHEGHVVSRSELLEHVWEQPSTLSTRTVDNFILRLRKYFEVDPANPQHFLSVRGAGYRFVADGTSGRAPGSI